MAKHVQLPAILQHLQRLLRPPSAARCGDGLLLERFVAARDETAFTALVQRYGSLVMDVCQRILNDPHDAEDAFQATFLVLARQAASIRRRASIGSWLYGVAYRVASRAKSNAVRRRMHEQRVLSMTAATPAGEVPWLELKPVLDEELHRLPEKYRLPLVLCYLEGKTHEEAARELGCPVGSMSWRLNQARDRLRTQLSRRGVALSTAVLGAALSQARASAVVPVALVQMTVRTAMHDAAGKLVAAGSVAALAEEAIRSSFVSPFRIAAAAVLVLGAIGLGWSLVRTSISAQEAPTADPIAAAEDTPPPPAQKPVRWDRHGDPLPADALARLGTVRFRHRGFTPIAFSADARHLISGGVNGFKVWETATGKELRRFGDFAFTPEPFVYCSAVGIAADGRTTVVVDQAKRELRQWEAATGRVLRRYPLNEEVSARHAVLSPCADHLAAFDESRLTHFDMTTGKATELSFWGNGVRTVVFSPDSKRLALACRDAKVRIYPLPLTNEKPSEEWEVAGFKPVASQNARAVLFSPDSQTLVTVSPYDVQFWEGNPRKAGRTLEVADPCVVFAPDGKLVAIGAGDGTVRLWDWRANREVRRWPAHSNALYWLAFTPDGKTLGSASSLDATVRLWDVTTGRALHKFSAQGLFGSDGFALTFSGDSRLLALRNEHRVCLWDVGTGRELPATDGSTWSDDAVVSADFKVMIAQDQNHNICLSSLATGKELCRLANVQWPPERGGCAGVAVACTPDSKLLAWGGTDPLIRLFDMATGKELRSFPGEAEGNTVLGFSRDGKMLITESRQREVHSSYLRTWDVATGKSLGRFRLTQLVNIPAVLAFTPEGRPLIAGEGGSDVQSWDVLAEKLYFSFPRASENIRGGNRFVVFSDDGTLAALGSSVTVSKTNDQGEIVEYDHTAIRVWDLATRQQLRQVPKDLMNVHAGAFAPDSRILALGDEDGTIRLVELATGKVVRELRGHEGEVTALTFSRDGKTLLSRSKDTTGLLWDLTGGSAESPPDNLGASELARLWADLASDDAAQAQRAVRSLAARPNQALPLLREKLRPIVPVEAPQVALLLARLESEQFTERQQATAELAELDRAAEPALRQRLAAKPSLEVRQRVEQLLAQLEAISPQRLRAIRAVAVVEQIGGPETRPCLENLARGVPSARLTQEAKASLRRLSR